MRKQRFRSGYHIAVAAGITVVFVSTLAIIFIGWRNRLGNEKGELVQAWEDAAYDRTFELSAARLEETPMDYFLLVLHGFSAYQIAVAQINNSDTLTYIDECIWSLRKALLCKEAAGGDPGISDPGIGDPRIAYVLGKAYYYKGESYADLSVKYLEAARSGGYEARDIPEYLGLAYAAVHDYRNSVAAFSLALDPGMSSGEEIPNIPTAVAVSTDADPAHPVELLYAERSAPPSDMLLLAIARSYLALGEYDAAKAYLVRCLDISKDSNVRVMTWLLLGGIYVKTGDSAAAERQYLDLLEEAGENAEAHYQLGELYAAAGDTTRARAERRKAQRINQAMGRLGPG